MGLSFSFFFIHHRDKVWRSGRIVCLLKSPMFLGLAGHNHFDLI